MGKCRITHQGNTYWSLFFNKAVQVGNFNEKEALVQVFSCEFCKIFANTFFTKHIQTTRPSKSFQSKIGRLNIKWND